jgi:queuine/archaeosine tRNA-ribosyltransferase
VDIKNNIIYFPAFSVGPIIQSLKTGQIQGNKNFRFYSKGESFFDYDKILISAAHNYKDIQTAEKMCLNKEKNIIFGDSGGFQVATGQLKLCDDVRDKIFNWLENNTTVAAILDNPPFVSSTNVVGQNSFEESLNITVNNAKYFEKFQSGKTQYLKILQGRSFEHIKCWYDNIKGFNFTGGWAIGSASVNLFYILQSFLYLMKNGEFEKNKGKIFHFFGVSKAHTFIYLIYLQELLNKNGIDIILTIDSSVPTILAAFGNYMLFLDNVSFKSCKIPNTVDYTKLDIDDKLPCTCPVCKDLVYRDLLSNELKLDSKGYSIITLHNLHKMLEYSNIIERLIRFNFDNLDNVFSSKELTIFNIIKDSFYHTDPVGYLNKYKEILLSLDTDIKAVENYF